ncbi:PREDICTED: syntaxin-6-like, partial [Priapulus caudatus]|uniref:Syntaxin-6-like n=1 Tax=Priapulus caudatus TaxID=37621 RepID=A0ABM1F6A9_PRICU
MGEVSKAVATSRSLYARWCELVHDPDAVSKEEVDWTTNELRNSIRSIEWDLEDLDETIGIVEKNPRKFKISEADVEERKSFVDQTRLTVKEMKDHVANPRSKPQKDGKSPKQRLLETSRGQYSKYTRLENEVERSNSQFVDDTHQSQQLMIRAQDEQLDMIGE